jgi:hypothetical protein
MEKEKEHYEGGEGEGGEANRILTSHPDTPPPFHISIFSQIFSPSSSPSISSFTLYPSSSVSLSFSVCFSTFSFSSLIMLLLLFHSSFQSLNSYSSLYSLILTPRLDLLVLLHSLVTLRCPSLP